MASLQRVTQIAARNPKRTILAVTCLSLMLLVVGLFTNFTLDVDEDKLWTPANSKPVKHSDWIEESKPGFPVESRDFILFFHANGANVLGQSQLNHVFEALDTVRGVRGYDRICAKSTYINPTTGETTCEIDGVVNFWNLTTAIFEDQIGSDQEAIEAMSALTFPDGSPVSENGVFGKPERSSDGTLVSAQSYSITFALPGTDEEEVEDFEEDALDAIHDLSDALEAIQGNNLRLEVLAERSFGDEYVRCFISKLQVIKHVIWFSDAHDVSLFGFATDLNVQLCEIFP